MESNISYPWETITPFDFERLALDYARHHFPYYKWQLTSQTRDGNKDVIAYNENEVLSDILIDQFWVEAKHSKNCSTLTKQRLDPTLVSAIIEPNVKSIIFITNGYFSSNYVARAQAFCKLKDYLNVSFIDNSVVENWVRNNISIKKKYFINTLNNNNSDSDIFEITSSFFMRQIDYIRGVFKEITALEVNRTHILYFVVNSSCNRVVKIDSITPKILIHAGYDDCIEIKKGLTGIPLEIKANEFKNIKQIILKLKDLKNYTLYSYQVKCSLVQCDEEIRVINESYLKISQNIYEILTQNYKLGVGGVITIWAEGGNGKSFMLSELSCAHGISQQKTIVFSEELTNAKLLCELILYLNFGNLYTLDKNIIDQLILKLNSSNQQLFNELLLGVSSSKDALSCIDNINTVYSDQALLCNLITSKNIIFLDDIHKLSKPCLCVLNKLLKNSNDSNLSLIYLSFGRENEIVCEDEKQKLVNISALSYEILSPNKQDIRRTLLQNVGQEITDTYLPLAETLTTTSLDLGIFILSLQSLSCDENLTLLIADNEKKISQSLVFNRAKYLKNIFILFPKIKSLVDLIFSVEIGIYEEFVLKFFKLSLIELAIKYKLIRRVFSSNEVMLLPWHDLVVEAFKAASILEYNSKTINIVIKYISENPNLEPSLLHILLESSKPSTDIIYRSIEYIKTLVNNTDFGIAFYLCKALYNVVMSHPIELLGISSSESLYIAYQYADCLNHCYSSKKALSHFNELLDKFSVGFYSNSLNTWSYKIIAEIVNIKYWHLDTYRLTTYIDEKLSLLQKRYKIDDADCDRLIQDAWLTLMNRKMTTLMLEDKLDASKDCFQKIKRTALNIKPQYNANLYIDFAKAIYIYDPYESLRKLRIANLILKTNINEKRRFLTCNTEIAYLRCIINDSDISELIESSSLLLKNKYYQEYSKSLLKIATILIYNDQLSEADMYISKYMSSFSLKEGNRNIFLMAQTLSLKNYVKSNKYEYYDYCENHLHSVSNLGSSYIDIAKNNLNQNELNRKIVWGHEPCTESFVVDTRIW